MSGRESDCEGIVVTLKLTKIFFADLNKVESRIDTKWYTTLSQFIRDMTLIFDNCRYYNPKESQFYRCAETLEAFFLQKIKQFRDNVVEKC